MRRFPSLQTLRAELTLCANSRHWRTPFLHGWLRVHSVLQLRKYILNGLDRLGLAFLGQLVPVNFQRQALLVAADNSSLLRQVVVEADNAVRPYWLGEAFDS